MVLYEMLYGYPPFASEDPMTTYENIVSWQTNLEFPPEIPISHQAESSIRRWVSRMDISAIQLSPNSTISDVERDI